MYYMKLKTYKQDKRKIFEKKNRKRAGRKRKFIKEKIMENLRSSESFKKWQ